MNASAPLAGHRWRIGFDIGGTFTDFILYDSAAGSVRLHKRLTTPHDPSIAALQGLEELVAMGGIALADVGEIIHGTTLVTNAVIERKGAKLGLITTEGFRDILEMGTEQRYDIYDLFLGFPEPLVPRDLRLEVPERMDRDGNAVTALDEGAVRDALRLLVEQGVEAVAVCLLNAYRNPAHEKRVGEIARGEFPLLSVSLSAEVVAEMWEYQRSVTTCANAYVQPLMDRYLQRLERELAARGFTGALRLMHSAGGLVSPATARAFPIRLLESGPAGGGLATALFGTLAGQKDVISFDMGGTTAKACMIEDGRVEIAPMLEAGRVHRFSKGSGLPIKAPVIDMIEIGAGGGSIAQIDAVGLLKVGPHSAGSDPGPACYGMGGTKPTVTDANLVLGYYDPGFFLGGRMSLDLDAARRAVESVAAPLKLDVMDAAWGIHKVVVESMAAAARVHLVEKGKDPRGYAMVGFGGAGPAHAADVARALGVREVIIPPASGAASALGFLAAPLSFETARSLPVEFSPGFDAALVNGVLEDLAAEGRARLLEAGVAPEDIRVERSADMRLVGQMHDIAVPLPEGAITGESLEEIRANFGKVYAARYTSLYDGARMEAINFRVRCVGPEPVLSLTGAVGGGDSTAKVKGHRRAWFEGGWQEATVYDRYALVAGDRIPGPAIIEERESTTIVPPGDVVTVDAGLNLRIAIAATAQAGALVTPCMALEEACARIEADPIALEIMWSRLVTVVEEMWLTVCRTAFSLVISESQDFACELLDPEGETLAHSPRAMPVFNLCLPLAVKALLQKYPSHTLQPGDVLITNDPWLCAGHLFDIAIVTPVFRDGQVVGLMGTVGHVSDIGGTKDSLRAREIFEEGLQIPPMKLYEAGRPSEALFALLRENVRNPEQVLGDVHSFVAANRLGAERLLAFMADYGMQDLRALATVVQRRSETAMRDAIRALPDGVYRSTISNNPLGQVLSYPLKLTVEGDAIELDFDGAPPQLPQGGLNSTMNYTAAHATYPLKCMLTPGVRGNAGCYRPFTVKAPEGSVLNAKRPAAVNMRTRTGWYLAPNIFRALSGAAPDKVQANTGLPMAAYVYGQDEAGRTYSDMLFIGGGQGASAHGDGKSGLLWPTSASNTSIELFEARVPVLVLEKTYLPDSGGPGAQRGGLGQRVRLRKLREDGLVSFVSVYPEGVGNPIPGLFGGEAGRGARGRVLDDKGALLEDCGTGRLVQVQGPGEIVEICIAGGSGYGDPARRAPEAVARDVRLGMVTEDGAARDYAAARQKQAEPA
ncbi:hydantoinase B/oxoprolinase family protein [Teichococcus cervicalis]|uniref:Hydantoinase/oxoprolinase n=1 Tax=Pseudoroseomonas cervicalis ATCC 49957 TaxID=525371 RepID=D5RGZ1_9PROT|nr:hydantoinase B/oxoprolinase family protein [Pseudoroseomonas cervicalis]EFH13423.1 hydantoinase/oxoprolinase [Pseudoroseomonas cervicalis ATCC 49957]